MCVVLSCGVVVRMAMVVSGLNQCSVKRLCKRVSTVVLELKERVISWLVICEWSMKGEMA